MSAQLVDTLDERLNLIDVEDDRVTNHGSLYNSYISVLS
jgi:hypothetical protein